MIRRALVFAVPAMAAPLRSPWHVASIDRLASETRLTPFLYLGGQPPP
jgi:hypothetical protein